MLVSTLKYLFQGKKDLFNGLWIAEQGEWEWKEHPVIVLDFNGIRASTPEALQQNLSFIDVMKLILNNCPGWMKFMLGSIITYDLIFVFVTAGFYLKEDSDRYVLWYTQFRLTFYALALAILVSTYRTWKNYNIESTLEKHYMTVKANSK